MVFRAALAGRTSVSWTEMDCNGQKHSTVRRSKGAEAGRSGWGLRHNSPNSADWRLMLAGTNLRFQAGSSRAGSPDHALAGYNKSLRRGKGRSAAGRVSNLSGELEQVHVRVKNCRGLRLEWTAGLAAVLALALLPASVAAQDIATETTLTVETGNQGGRTQATASVTVTGADGQPATGVVLIDDGNRQLAEAALNGEGQATLVLPLAGGDHALRAVYVGDAEYMGSASLTSNLTATGTSSTPNFTLSLTAVSPSSLPLTLTPGASGIVAVTVIPEDNTALTSPMFVELSCSGLPEQTSCTFTPQTVEILPTTPASCASGSPVSKCPPVSSMLIQTQEQVTRNAVPHGRPLRGNSPVAWAFLLPGMAGLGGLAWGARRRRWLQRMALVALLGLVTTVGTTSCRALYGYYEHGPAHPNETPPGTYTITVTGQSSNGVTAITNSTTFVLTVQ